jgi:hypothetical protein
MRSEERNAVRGLIEKHGGDRVKAVAEWLGSEAQAAHKGMDTGGKLKYPVGWDAAFHGIIDEVERCERDDAAGVAEGTHAAIGSGDLPPLDDADDQTAGGLIPAPPIDPSDPPPATTQKTSGRKGKTKATKKGR